MPRLPPPARLLAIAAALIGFWGGLLAVLAAMAGAAELCRLSVLVAAGSAIIFLAILLRYQP